MENFTLARRVALFVLPMIVASCGGSSDQGLIKNSPDKALAGCTTVAADDCNTTKSGVAAKLYTNPDTGEISVRFFNLTDNGGGTYTYNDGEDEVVVVGATLPEEIDFDILAAAWSVHTDASVVPTSGTATYGGTNASYWTMSGLHGEGGSTLQVDFAGKTADLFTLYTVGDGIGTVNKINSLNMDIDGYSFTGDEVYLYLDDVPVDLTGPNSEGAGAGLFFGPIDPGLLVPTGFGAIAVLTGDDDAIWTATTGVAVSSTP